MLVLRPRPALAVRVLVRVWWRQLEKDELDGCSERCRGAAGFAVLARILYTVRHWTWWWSVEASVFLGRFPVPAASSRLSAVADLEKDPEAAPLSDSFFQLGLLTLGYFCPSLDG